MLHVEVSAYKYEDCIFRSALFGNLLPLHEFLQCLLSKIKKEGLGNVVDQEDGSRIPEECLDDGPEALLTSRVPDLQFHTLMIFHGNSLTLKLSACISSQIPMVVW